MSEFRSRWTSWTPPAVGPVAPGEPAAGAAYHPSGGAHHPGEGFVSFVSARADLHVHEEKKEEEEVVLHAPRARGMGVGGRTDKTDKTPLALQMDGLPARECIPCRLWTEFSRCPRCRADLGGPPDPDPLPPGWDDFGPPVPACPVPCGGGWGMPHAAACPRRRGLLGGPRPPAWHAPRHDPDASATPGHSPSCDCNRCIPPTTTAGPPPARRQP